MKKTGTNFLAWFVKCLALMAFTESAGFAQIYLPAEKPRSAKPPRIERPSRPVEEDEKPGPVEAPATPAGAASPGNPPPATGKGQDPNKGAGFGAGEGKPAIAPPSKEPLSGAFLLDILVPFIKVSGPREDFTADITTQFQWQLRKIPAKADGISLIYGLRVAAFSGSGVQNSVPGRYGFFYFGPMVGLGKFGLAEDSSESTTEGAKNWQDPISAWTVVSGLAGMNRLGKKAEVHGDSDDDFTSKPFVYDSPGFWAEGRFTLFHLPRFGTSYGAGFQIGTGKQFYYALVGVAGWY